MIALLLLGAALAGDPAQELAGHKDQAAFFVRRGWWRDAELEVAAALALPGGPQDPDLLWLGARVAYENVDVGLALSRAEAALALLPEGDARDLVDAWAARIRDGYGFVRVDTPQAGVVSRLQIEPQTELFDPEDQRFASRAALFWRDLTPLPATLSLPVGLWLVNGQPVQVQAASTNELSLPLRLAGRGALSALQVTRLEGALGVGAWVGEDTANLGPGLRGQLALVQPVGPLLIGITGELTLQPWYTSGHQARLGPLATGLGGKVGGEIFLGGPLALRPSATLRWVQLPGLTLMCEDGEIWSCNADGPASGPAHQVYTQASGLAPGLELLVEYREAGRTTALGTGVKLSAERVFGQVPEQGEASLEDGGAQGWRSDGASWVATGLGMMASVGVAF